MGEAVALRFAERHFSFRLGIGAIMVVLMAACSSKPESHFVTERDARLILVARQAATANGISLTDAIYEVRPEGDGWNVMVDRAPGYKGVGEPSVVVDSGFFVRINSDEVATEIMTPMKQIKLSGSQ